MKWRGAARWAGLTAVCAVFIAAMPAAGQERAQTLEEISRRIEAIALEIDRLKMAREGAIEVPFLFTRTQHILVRAKINGAGPYNFILDTGAPALFISTEVAGDLGIEASEGWGTIARYEIEGGAMLENVRARIEDPFQLTSMNAIGMPGEPLHGVIGYNVAARFRMEIDLRRRHMTWTPLDWTPPEPGGAELLFATTPPEEIDTLIEEGEGFARLAEMSARMMSAMTGGPPGEKVPRGYLGIELEGEDALVVSAVHEGSPAERVGLRAGDRIVSLNETEIAGIEGLMEAANKIAPGDRVKLGIERAGAKRTYTFKAGRGYE